MEGLWLNLNLIFQICSASIFMQPLCQEMILRWGLIRRWTLIQDRCVPTGEESWDINVQQCYGWCGAGTAGLVSREKQPSIFLSINTKTWFVCFFSKLKTLILNADYYRNSPWAIFWYCQCFANKESDCNHVHLLIVGDSNRSKCRTLSDYSAAQHGGNQELRPAQSSQTTNTSMQTRVVVAAARRSLCLVQSY